MLEKNPMLQTPVWTFADMAVAQDWELEQGNESALLWTDLGPEMARVLCENPEVLGMLTRFVEEPWARAGAGARARAEAGAGVWVRAGRRTWTRARAWAWAGGRTWTRARVRVVAEAGAGAGVWAGKRARS